MHNDFPYDLESYPNVFSAVIVHAASGTEWIFEVSDRVNQSRQLLNFVRTLGQHPGNRMVGYNNAGSDTHTRTVRHAWNVTSGFGRRNPILIRHRAGCHGPPVTHNRETDR